MLYLMAKKSSHWSAEKNLRFSLVRFECDSWADIQDVRGAIWDREEKQWNHFHRISVKGHWEFSREATMTEVMLATKQQELDV